MADREHIVKTDAGTSIGLAEQPPLRKAAEAIAINPRSGKVTLLTRKLFNVLLRLSQKDEQSVLTHRALLSQITRDAAFDSKDDKLIREHLKKMNVLQVEWNSTGVGKKDGRRWGVTTLLADAEVLEDPKTGRVMVEWSFSPKIKKRLLDPAVYARLSLQFQSQLRSTASLALFEICSRYSTSPAGLTLRESWFWWRPRLTGTPDDQPGMYTEYKYFKRDVLRPAIHEVNIVTDLAIELIEHKIGRNIDEIQFRVRPKQQGGLGLQDPNLFDASLIERMAQLGVAKRDTETLYSEHEESLIRSTLAFVEQRLRDPRKPKVDNPAAFFKDALKRGYAAVKEASPTALNNPNKLPGKKKLTMEEVRVRYQESLYKNAQKMFAEMSLDQQAEELKEFEDSVLPTKSQPVTREFKKKGLESGLAASAFFRWLCDKTWGDPTDADLLQFMLDS